MKRYKQLSMEIPKFAKGKNGGFDSVIIDGKMKESQNGEWVRFKDVEKDIDPKIMYITQTLLLSLCVGIVVWYTCWIQPIEYSIAFVVCCAVLDRVWRRLTHRSYWWGLNQKVDYNCPYFKDRNYSHGCKGCQEFGVMDQCMDEDYYKE